MKEMHTILLNQSEQKALRRVFNALGSVPFVRTQKPSLDFNAIEQRLRSSVPADNRFDFSCEEIETILKSIDAVFAEYPDAASRQLYLGSQHGEITQLRNTLDALIHVPA